MKGPEGLLALRVPVNRFPDFVAELVKFLHATFPLMGAVRMAQVLGRAGLHLAPTTVRRFRRASRRPKSAPPSAPNPARLYPGIVAKAPYRLFHVDLTAVKRVRGFWAPWFPFSLPQCWPFCWWVVGVIDHYSRAVLALKAFRANPTSAEVIGVLQAAMRKADRQPRYIISDQGPQFRDDYKRWCKALGINPRFGAVGKKGSIAIIERFWLSMKSELFWRINVERLSERMMQDALQAYVAWYNTERPHQSLQGATPAEKLSGRKPKIVSRKYEVREGFPARASPGRQMPLRVKKLELVVTTESGYRELPNVRLRKVA